MTNISKTTQQSGQTKKRVVFFGNERLISGLPHTDTPILKALIEHGYDVVAVVSHHTSGKASRNNRTLEVAIVAEAYGIPLFLPDRPSEILDQLTALNPDFAVLVAYGKIVSQKVIDIFAGGIINVHPSLLPKYRGPTPIESAILNDDRETGVSIMQLSAKMDEGPVYASSTIKLDGSESKLELYSRLASESTQLLLDTLPKIIDGLQPVQQDDLRASYCALIQKSDGVINWHEDAAVIERKIRAYSEWPQSRTTIGPVDIIIISAHPVHIEPFGDIGSYKLHDDQLFIQSVSGQLSVDVIKPIGKKEMPVKAFLSGYATKLTR